MVKMTKKQKKKKGIKIKIQLSSSVRKTHAHTFDIFKMSAGDCNKNPQRFGVSVQLVELHSSSAKDSKQTNDFN